MLYSQRHREFPLLYLNVIVEQALKHGYIKFYYDFRGDPIAYVIWAFVADDVEAKFLETGIWKIHASEWNEGKSLWIVDLVTKPGVARNVLRRFSRDVLQREDSVKYFRYRKNVFTCKEYKIPSYVKQRQAADGRA
jgi:hemolysin-activating ACP:hemolysin acyltransferase